MLVAADQSPVLVAADQSPVLVAADQFPVLVAADWFPVLVAADRFPVLNFLSSSQLTWSLMYSRPALIIPAIPISALIEIFFPTLLLSSDFWSFASSSTSQYLESAGG